MCEIFVAVGPNHFLPRSSLQLGVLVFKLLQTLALGDIDAAVFGLPVVKRRLRRWFTTGRNESGLATSEDVLLDDRVDAPVAVNHLGDTEVDADCDQ